VTAAASDHKTLDRRLTHAARLALTAIDAVFQLEEAFLTVRVDVVGDA
jgi:hypothetical protein